MSEKDDTSLPELDDELFYPVPDDDPPFEPDGETVAGGWWQPADGGEPQPERREHPRVPFDALVHLIPPDGTVHRCQAVNLSLGGVLLHKTEPGDIPDLGQMVEVEVVDEEISLEGLVVRVEKNEPRFAVQFVNLDARRREYLAGAVGAAKDDDDSSTTYAVSKRKG
jgi:hypothetical protein